LQRQVSAYYERFRPLLNPTNAQHLQLVLRIARALESCLRGAQAPQDENQLPAAQLPPAGQQQARVVSVNNLMFDLGLDCVNMFQLMAWLKDNQMVFKVCGRTDQVTQQAGSHPKQHNPMPFLAWLLYPALHASPPPPPQPHPPQPPRHGGE